MKIYSAKNRNNWCNKIEKVQT